MILGKGMLARAFSSRPDLERDAVIFAKGVSDSSTEAEEEFAREIGELIDAIQHANTRGSVFVYFSSGGAVYGTHTGCRREDLTLKPVTRYGWHKQQCEEIVQSEARNYIVARLPNVVGDGGSLSQLVPALVHQIVSGNVRVRKRASRDLLHSRDVVLLLSKLIEAGADREVFNVASGISSPVIDIVSWISNELGVNPNIQFQDDGEAQVFSIEKLKSLLGDVVRFEPTYPKSLIQEYCRNHENPADVQLAH